MILLTATFIFSLKIYTYFSRSSFIKKINTGYKIIYNFFTLLKT